MHIRELADLQAKGKSVDEIAGIASVPKQPKVKKERKKPEPSAHCFNCKTRLGVLIWLGGDNHVCPGCREEVKA